MPTFFNRTAPPGHTWKLALALSLVYVVWGTTYFALDVAMRDTPPLFMNGTRFVLAGAVMLAWARWQGQAWPSAAQWRCAALVGGLMAFGAMGLVVWAQRLGIGSGLMATVVTTMPMWLALWSRLGGEPVPLTGWIGLALGGLGALLLALEGDFAATGLGALCAFAAPLCWSLGSYASRRLDLPAPAMSSAAQWLAGGAMGVLAAWVFEPLPSSAAAWGQWWHQIGWASWLAWCYLVVMGTLVTLNAYLWLLQNTSPALAGSYSFVNPAVALLVGVAWAGERLTGWVFLAMPLILSALALILYGPALARTLIRLAHRVAGRRPVRSETALR